MDGIKGVSGQEVKEIEESGNGVVLKIQEKRGESL